MEGRCRSPAERPARAATEPPRSNPWAAAIATTSSPTRIAASRSVGSASSVPMSRRASTQIGPVMRLPSSFDHTAMRISGTACPPMPPAATASASAISRGVMLPSSSPSTTRPSSASASTTPGSTTVAAE